MNFFNYKDIMFKEPSPICNGMHCCENKTHDSNDSMCKECDADYDAAMEQVRNPTPQMIEETAWLTEAIRGTYNVAGV